MGFLEKALLDLSDQQGRYASTERQLIAQAAKLEAVFAQVVEQEAEVAQREAAVDEMHESIAAIAATLEASAPSDGAVMRCWREQLAAQWQGEGAARAAQGRLLRQQLAVDVQEVIQGALPVDSAAAESAAVTAASAASASSCGSGVHVQAASGSGGPFAPAASGSGIPDVPAVSLRSASTIKRLATLQVACPSEPSVLPAFQGDVVWWPQSPVPRTGDGEGWESAPVETGAA